MNEFGKQVLVALIALLALALPLSSAVIVTPAENVTMALTVANGALQSEGCQKLWAENYPVEERTAIQVFMTEIWISWYHFSDGPVADDAIGVVFPLLNPRRIILNEAYIAILPPLTLAETIIHEYWHLADYVYGPEEKMLVTEEQAQRRAKACIDALWVAYPSAKPDDWVDGPRPLKD